MGEHKVKFNIDADADFAQDILNEQDFDSEVKKINKQIAEGDILDAELKSMIDVYKQQINGLTTLRFDVEIFSLLQIQEPGHDAHRIDKESAITSLKRKRVTVAVIRKQILKKMRGEVAQ